MTQDELSAEINQSLAVLDRDLKSLEPNDKKRTKIVSYLATKITTFQSHSGPLPSPEVLKKYDELLPGTAERIISMAERQSAHRVELEKKVIPRQLNESTRGQILGFIIALVFGAASYSLGMNGHDILAGTLGGTTLISLTTTFVVGRKKQQDELKKK